jgi:2-succinyl-5-enolpyruvyl-6-hydroxy-3-cyclohexene-1-carboxylate synthase
MKTSIIPSARTVIYHCRMKGIRNIVISPGSRNAPLTLGFTGDPYFNCYSIVDERCAAFFALGMAQQLRHGVAVVCTSGSALLNYYPAVAEAFYSGIPLIVISADRPSYKIDIGDGQTIRQDHVFQRHIGQTALLKLDVIHATKAIRASGKNLPTDAAALARMQNEIQEYNDATLNQSLGFALNRRLPVHINVPFEEPLYQTSIEIPTSVKPEPPPLKDDIALKGLSAFGAIWQQARRKMLIVGAGYPKAVDERYLKILADDPSVLVFTETTSNCHHPGFFPGIDSIIAPLENSENRNEKFMELQPEVLLTFGGMVVSKKIKAFLREFRPLHHWHLGPGKAYDTYFSLSHHFSLDPNDFFKAFEGYMKPVESSYNHHWSGARDTYRKKREAYLRAIPFSDMLAFHHILGGIPEHYQVQLANSSTVRYSQLFDMNPSLRIFCNRGTSGIDGSTSTAIGAALVDKHPTVLISGDLSFIYDSNGLWNNYVRPDFRIILINNHGGGIFRILPGRRDDENFETYFETVQDLDIAKLCQFYGIAHSTVASEAALTESFSTFYKPSKTAKLLEIQTPRLENNKILLAYFDFLS